jgi:predicted RNA-binding protein YlxR (DUF448 family)
LGTVEIDEGGKKSGRGAYLCRTRDCWDTALKKKSLEYSLKTAISLEDNLEFVGRETTVLVEGRSRSTTRRA